MLFSLLIMLVIAVPPIFSLRRMLVSRSPYKKVEKTIAIIGIACIPLLILAWAVYLSWSKATGYNPGF